MLDPRCKLDYFHVAGWEEEWIEAAREIVNEEFERGYAGIYIESEDKELSLVCDFLILLLYLIKTWGHSSFLISTLPAFFKTCCHAQALSLPTRSCVPNSCNTLALDLKM